VIKSSLGAHSIWRIAKRTYQDAFRRRYNYNPKRKIFHYLQSLILVKSMEYKWYESKSSFNRQLEWFIDPLMDNCQLTTIDLALKERLFHFCTNFQSIDPILFVHSAEH
jgi:hypothetical protein